MTKANQTNWFKAGQAAMEYMLLLGIVVAAVLIFFKRDFPTRVKEYTNMYYNQVSTGIFGQPPRCGDGVCDKGEGKGRGNCAPDCPL